MFEKIFAPKAAQIDQHPEWLPAEEPETNLDKLPEEFIEQTTGAEYVQPRGDTISIELPPVEIPEHLPNWFDITAEALDELQEDTALGNLAAIGKMGAHDPKIIKDYVEQIPREQLKQIQEHCIEIACEQAKKLNAHIMGRETLESKELFTQQKKLKKLFNIGKALTAGGLDDLSRTLIQLEAAHERARQIELTAA
ncbi:hypothetical protein GF391_01955 [Candidatus Uhrbacteria bacterium]|nr:hypothetical protein [Candidatus Uhrbacteria bacterium]